MYLKEHFVVLNRGEGNFGLHYGAILLDPISTFGTNIMLEIYNSGDQPVVNPVVSVEVFRAPTLANPEVKTLEKKRLRLYASAHALYDAMDKTPPRDSAGEPRPKTRITVRGQNALMENHSVFLNSGDFSGLEAQLAKDPAPRGFRTLIQALDHAPDAADTLVVEFFPDLLEHVELLTRIPELKLKRLIFRQPSRTHGYLPLEQRPRAAGHLFEHQLQCYWYDESTKDLYLHTYKKEHGFFVREEMGQQFQEADHPRLLRLGGRPGARTRRDRIAGLVGKLDRLHRAERWSPDRRRRRSDAPGHRPGPQRAGPSPGRASSNSRPSRRSSASTSSTRSRTSSRHFRQKWFEVADFCIFNVGGVGTLEEIGIEMCNLKLGIRPRVPYVFFNAGSGATSASRSGR